MRVINAVVLGAFLMASMCRADVLYTFSVNTDLSGQPLDQPVMFSFDATEFLTLPIYYEPTGTTARCSPGGWPIHESDVGCEGFFNRSALDQSTYTDVTVDLFTPDLFVPISESFPNADFEQFGTYQGIDIGMDNVTGTLTVAPTPEPSTWGLLGIGLALFAVTTRRRLKRRDFFPGS